MHLNDVDFKRLRRDALRAWTKEHDGAKTLGVDDISLELLPFVAFKRQMDHRRRLLEELSFDPFRGPTLRRQLFEAELKFALRYQRDFGSQAPFGMKWLHDEYRRALENGKVRDALRTYAPSSPKKLRV